MKLKILNINFKYYKKSMLKWKLNHKVLNNQQEIYKIKNKNYKKQKILMKNKLKTKRNVLNNKKKHGVRYILNYQKK